MNPLAKRAESRVCKWVELQGWKILRTNYRGVGFEVDFFATKGSILLAGEVKARPKIKLSEDIHITEVLSRKQIERIKKGAEVFTSENDVDYEAIRIDLFVVIGKGQNQLARYKNIGLNI